MTDTPSILPLTLIQLRCFLAIVDQGSFAAAGRQLGMTTSAVSKTIAKFEQARSVRLLTRSTHALSLTPEGERLLPLIREAFDRFDAVEAAMGDAAGGTARGTVRISAPTAFLSTCLVPLAKALRAAHPEIVLELRGSDAMDDLADEGIDLALRTGRISGIPGHLRQPWFRFPWVTCAAPAYLDERGTPDQRDELASHDLIGFRNRGSGLVEPWRYRTSSEGDGTARWNHVPTLILDDANAVRSAALAGLGLIRAPRWLVADDLAAGRLVPVLSDLAGPMMDMSIIRRAHAHTPARTALVIAFLLQRADRFA